MTAQRAMGNGQRVLTKVFIFSLLIAHCPLLIAQSPLAAQAQLAWQDRDKPGKTEEAISLWKQAAQAEPNRTDLWVALAKAQGRAVRHAATPEEHEKWAKEARASSEKAIKSDPSSSDAFAAYGEALGQWANAHKGIHSLGLVRQAVEALEKATTLNPKNAYAHMLLAEFYRQSPRHISIGDKHKALEQAQLAVQYGPGYAINHLALARAYLDLDKKEDGIAELQKIMTLQAPPDAVPETHADQQTASAMLKEKGIVSTPKIDGQTESQSPLCGQAGGVCSEQTQ